MTWLFPFYLLGALAVIGPILMHLRRRPPQDRVEFSSLMFLEAQTPMPVSKRRLEHWLLLLLRCLALILLALMFARPLWKNEATVALGQNEAVLILLDRSGSMQRGDLWEKAKAEVTKQVSAAEVVDRVALATFDRDLELFWTFGEDRESIGSRVGVIQQRLDKIKPGAAATDLGLALIEASVIFGQEPGMTGMKKRIVVVTDFQEGSRLDALRGQVWPETIAVNVSRVDVLNADNLSLSVAATSLDALDSIEDLGEGEVVRSQVRVRLGNARDSKVSDYFLGWEQGGAETVNGYLPPGASRVLPAPPRVDEGKARVLRVTGDAWDFDNRVFIAPPQPKTVRIVFMGDENTRDEAASPLFYLSRALQKTATLWPDLQVISANNVAIPSGTDIVFISGAVLKEPQTKALHAFLETGGMVVKVVDESTTPEVITALSGAVGVKLTSKIDAAKGDYLMLAEVETAHPLFRPFADERLRDFTKLRFWSHRRLELDADAAQQLQVIARFDNRDPAILTASTGQGTLILLTSGWHPADSQLALSTKFVPLLYGWLEAAGFRNEQAASLLVGDVLPLEEGMTFMTPDGQTRTPKPGEVIRAEAAGFYTLQSETPLEIAVNLPPEESRVMPMDSAKLVELGLRIEMSALHPGATSRTEDRERLAISDQEVRQRAWLWLLGGLLSILGLETWLAGRIREGRAQATYS